MLLPGFLLVFQVIFIALFGLLVRYDDSGKPLTSNSTVVSDVSELDSSRSALKVYPCEWLPSRGRLRDCTAS